MPEWEIKDLEPLIEGLSSADAFARLETIEKLEGLTRRTFGFRFNDPPEARSTAIQRWKDWIEEQQQDQEQEEQLQTAVELSGGAIDLGALKKAIHEIPAGKIQGYLNALIQKMKGQQVRCEACHVRPANVRVTELEGGKPKTVHLCESCARERGDALL